MLTWIALASFLAMPTVSTLSQEPSADQRLTRDRSRRPEEKSSSHGKRLLPKGVFDASSLVNFRLHGGLVQLDPVRYRKGNQNFECPLFKESITVSCSHGVPSAYFQFEDSYQQLRMSVEYGRYFRVESTLRSTGESAILEQNEGQPIRWQTRRDPKQRPFTGCQFIGLDPFAYHCS